MVLNKVLEGKGDYGYNAQSQTYENLLDAGVIDPIRVVRFAIQNAASVSGLMLTTEAMVAEKPEEKKAGEIICMDIKEITRPGRKRKSGDPADHG